MRILALGDGYYDDGVDTETFRSMKSTLDYQVVVWDPAATIDAYTESPSFQGLPTFHNSEAASVIRDVSRRKQEFAEFLSLGRVLVVVTPPPVSCYVQTGTEYSGTGRNARMTSVVDEQNVLVAAPLAVKTAAATGRALQLVAGEPFATFWRRMRAHLYYTAYFLETPGTPLFTVAGTNRAVGAYVEVSGGTVLFLPPLDYGEDEADKEIETRVDREFVAALRDLVAALTPEATPLPPWVVEYLVPGESDLRISLADTEEALSAQVEARDRASAAVANCQAVKRLVVETGKPLERLVRQAFEELGARTEDADPGRTEFVLRWKRKTAVVEVKGVSKSAKEQDAAQLEKWVTEQYEKDGKRPKGILVVNAYRDLPPGDRSAPAFPNQMLKYARAREHILLTTTQLLGAVLEARSDPTAGDSALQALFDGVGPWAAYRDWRAYLTTTSQDTREQGARPESDPLDPGESTPQAAKGRRARP